MGKFFSIGGMSPSGGEGNMGGSKSYNPKLPSMEQLKARHPEFYKNRSEVSTASFADVGDRFKLHGDEAKVLHVERNSDGSQELTVQRSAQGNSGTYKIGISPDKGRRQQISKIKRSFD